MARLTEAQARLLRMGKTEGIYVYGLSGPERNAFNALYRKRIVKHSGFPNVFITNEEGSEELRRFEEGQT